MITGSEIEYSGNVDFDVVDQPVSIGKSWSDSVYIVSNEFEYYMNRNNTIYLRNHHSKITYKIDDELMRKWKSEYKYGDIVTVEYK